MRSSCFVLMFFVFSFCGCTSRKPETSSPDGSTLVDECGGLGCPPCSVEGDGVVVCHSDATCTTTADCPTPFPPSCSTSLGTGTTSFDVADCLAGRCIYERTVGACFDGTPCEACSTATRAGSCMHAPSVSECMNCCMPNTNDAEIVTALQGCACGPAGPCGAVCADSLLCGGTYATSPECASCLGETLREGGACITSPAFQAECTRTGSWTSCGRSAQCLWSCVSEAASIPLTGGAVPTGCPLAACCAPDSDTGTASFTITELRLPTSPVGSNLDDINNGPPPAGQGPSIFGCGAVDAPGGHDVSLGTSTEHVAPGFDLDAALAALFVGGAGGIPSPISLTASLGRVQNVNDACVDLTLTLAVDGYPTQTLHGTATSLDGGLGPIVVGDLDGKLVIPLPATHGVPSSGCQGGSCTDVPLEITLRGLRIRLESDAARTTLLPQSRLVGFIYYGDRSSAYSALGPSSLESGLAAFATQAGLTSTYATELSTAFASAVDLHMDSDGELGRCTGATLTTLDANAISFTLNLAGTAP